MSDIKSYEEWINGGDYKHYVLSRRGFFKRFLAVLTDLPSLVRQVKVGLSRENIDGSTHPDLARIKLEGREVPMIFSNAYWNTLCTSDELLLSQEWRSLRGLLVEFKELALEHDIIPIVLFIPTKLQVYGEFFSVQSGENFMRRIDKQLLFQDNSVEAMRKLTLELNIRLIDLTPGFRRLAAGGELLYYPIDSHWNPRGRQAAAQIISEALREPIGKK